MTFRIEGQSFMLFKDRDFAKLPRLSFRGKVRWFELRLRRMLLVETISGRPPEPSEEETQTLWDTWKQRIEGREERSLLGEDYLAMHEESGITLRAIWSQTRRWTEYGKLPAAANGR